MLCSFVFAVACGDDDETDSTLSPTALASPVDGTPEPEETQRQETPDEDETTPGAIPTEPPPTPDVPVLPPGAIRLSEGTVTFALPARGGYPINPEQLPFPTGVTPPTCQTFVFVFSWRVTDPSPAEDVIWTVDRDGSVEEIARGPSGDGQAGCGIVQASNDSNKDIRVAVHYLIGSTG